MTKSRFINFARATLRSLPKLKASLVEAGKVVGLVRHFTAQQLLIVIQPNTRHIKLAITSACNLRCVGCRYGRDFMIGHQLSLDMVRKLLDDAAHLGVHSVRFYGGEPLLHRDLSKMVHHCVSVGIKPYLTTNGILLRQRVDELHAAGLRTITIGYYGTGESYDAYVQTKGQFQRLDQNVSYVREKYGDSMDLQINFLLMRPTCTLEALREAWDFAGRYGTDFQVDLIHYSLPYFTEGPDRMLQFQMSDRSSIESVVGELMRLRNSAPNRFKEPVLSLRAIPDWLLQGPNMRVPCDAYNILWVGPDGTVQLCYVTFKLGNLHDHSLRDLLYTHAHRQAARNAFELACPNCHCERQHRIEKHLPSRLRYRSVGPSATGPNAASEQATPDCARSEARVTLNANRTVS